MRTIIVDESQSDKRIDKLIRETFSHMPVSAMHKAFRKKDIKANGIRVKDDYIVSTGDILEIYITDQILEGAPLEYSYRPNQGFSVVYEDSNILIVNKEQGIPVHPDKEQVSNTLIDLVQQYLSEKGEFSSHDSCSFKPSLCHRLDRNTGGLIIIAKNNESLKLILDKIQNKEIKKHYQCLVKGKMEKEQDVLKAYLEKDDYKSRVFVNDEKKKGSLEIITKYRVISYENDISRLEVELVTGRTHQIRAHLAYIGHPIIGDGKYGTNSINRSLGAKVQALWAYKIVFGFKEAGILSYLKGKEFVVNPEFKL